MLSLAEALAALPDTADGIAAHLTAKGVRGVRQNPACCPIANYLTGEGFDGAYVDVNFVDVSNAEPLLDTPTHIVDFVQRFDLAGAWPELVLDDAADDADPTNTLEP